MTDAADNALKGGDDRPITAMIEDGTDARAIASSLTYYRTPDGFRCGGMCSILPRIFTTTIQKLLESGRHIRVNSG
jgi:hypothetical protein